MTSPYEGSQDEGPGIMDPKDMHRQRSLLAWQLACRASQRRADEQREADRVTSVWPALVFLVLFVAVLVALEQVV